MSLLSPQLQAFMAVSQYKTVHAAATELHITQTGVTQRIRTLESRLKTTLFVRSRRGMTLTPEGQALLRYCQATLPLEGQAMAHINDTSQAAEVRICITGPTSLMRSRIIPQCFPVMKKFPNLLMEFNISDKEDRDKSLRQGQAEFAILKSEKVTKELQHKILQPETYVLVCTQKWKHRSLHDIISHERIIDYTPDDDLTFNYLKKYQIFNMAQKERHFVNRTESLSMMLSEGCGYGLLTTEFSQPDVNKKKLMILNQGKTYENTMVLAWYDRPEPPPYFQKIIDSID
jgi:LysR family transcriptional regulator, chromosome initiation inhibitor